MLQCAIFPQAIEELMILPFSICRLFIQIRFLVHYASSRPYQLDDGHF